MKRETLRKIMAALLTTLARVEFCGTENLLLEGGLIVATNHMSRVDTLLLFINPARKDITALVADKYKKYPIFNWILDVGGVIFLDRDKADFGAFRVAVEWINKGVAMGIAPEGTRSPIGQLQQGKPGVILLAQKTGVPVVPVGISGTETFFRDLMRLRRPKVRLNFGPAYRVPPLDRANRDEALKNSTEEIMSRIASLLPEKYWGYYKDYPRVRELAALQQGS
jgi:1-acyl-sn-glycerol-3-phosphate acyltransferase